jgi:hypothetical protein
MNDKGRYHTPMTLRSLTADDLLQQDLATLGGFCLRIGKAMTA